ncbi:MAG: (2R)-sulfolactate sulfo-lyase subunit beta [Syntrophaceae bacterium PtaU1.Bin231]|nr:MAG: (2R)-sulfolactate sulfo-lyase subunit beta [Syntrophaceae bacterium PtaU1.Bin231]HOG15744.1 UxaA family hydrolase [Syntrophales bacterium]
MSFMGYRREEGRAGTRNYVGLLSTVVCANEVAEGIAARVSGTVPFLHHQGCCQTPVDIARVNSVLTGLGCNPNLASVILVSLGCESTDVAGVAKAIAATGKDVKTIVIQEIGGAGRSVAEGALLAQEMVRQASVQQRTQCPASDIVLGLKCGSSDTTQGIAANPALGVASDLVVRCGGTSVLGEVTEFIGAEHLLVRHARNKEIGDKILALVKRIEDRAKSVGCDMRGGQPTGGNIKGGLTTIEEKSLGAIAKAGTAPIEAVYEYGQRPAVRGLVVMDSPGREPEILTGLAAAGCNVIAFTTGRGAPQGFPFVPVIKITGNAVTWGKLQDHIDLDVSELMKGTSSYPVEGQRIYKEILEVASGRMTKAEICGYTRAMDIYMVGPVI